MSTVHPSECRGCVLDEKGQGFASPEGPENSSILLVGEALGPDAEQAQEAPPGIRIRHGRLNLFSMDLHAGALQGPAKGVGDPGDVSGLGILEYEDALHDRLCCQAPVLRQTTSLILEQIL